MVSQRPGAQVLSDFATFPCSSFVKVRHWYSSLKTPALRVSSLSLIQNFSTTHRLKRRRWRMRFWLVEWWCRALGGRSRFTGSCCRRRSSSECIAWFRPKNQPPLRSSPAIISSQTWPAYTTCISMLPSIGQAWNKICISVSRLRLGIYTAIEMRFTLLNANSLICDILIFVQMIASKQSN